METDATTGLRHAGSPVPDAALPGLVRQQLLDGSPWSRQNADEVDGLVEAFAQAGDQGPALLAAVVAALGDADPLLRGQAVDFMLRIGAEAPAEAIAQAMRDHRPRLDRQRHPERSLLHADLYDCLLTVLAASAAPGEALALETLEAGAAAGRPGALGLARLAPARLLAEPRLLPRQALGGALLKMSERADRVALIQAFAPYPDADSLLPEAYWRRFGPEGEPLRALVEAHRSAGPPALLEAATAALDALPGAADPAEAQAEGEAFAEAIGQLSEAQRAALLGPRALMSPEALSEGLRPALGALQADSPDQARAALRALQAALEGAPSAGALGPVTRLLEATTAALNDEDADLDAIAARLSAMVGPRLGAAPRAPGALDEGLLRGLLDRPSDEAAEAEALRARVRSGIDKAMAGFTLKPLGPR